MRGPALALDQAPALAVTLPFLLVAPVFGVAAGALLAMLGPAALESRWTPGALALTHLLTAGFMLQAMCGALLQFAPVAIGVRFWRPRRVARVAQPLMLAGAVLLAWALGSGHAALATPAGLLLAAGIGVFMLSLAIGLWHATGQWRAAWSLWAALAALAVTVTLGLLLALALGGHAAVPLILVANLHALWGLAGWSLVLMISVSAIVVPMLQVTPRYPAWLQRALVGLILALLAAASLPGAGAGAATLAGTLALAAASHAVAILVLQARTRRPRGDASVAYMLIAMACILALCLGWAMAALGIAALASDAAIVTAGILVLVGVFSAAISGMLCKIVPFMIWLKLCESMGVRHAPTTGSLLKQAHARGQLGLFAMAAIALLLAPSLPSLARVAGLLFAGSSAWLAINTGRAAWLHRRALRTQQPQR